MFRINRFVEVFRRLIAPFCVLLLLAVPAAKAQTPPTLTSIALSPENKSVAVNTIQALLAVGTYSDGSTRDLTNTVSWASSDTAVATIVASGIVKATGTGTATITASVGSIIGTTTLTANAAQLISIAVTPAIPQVPFGRTVQFTATGTFNDGSIQDITNVSEWTSSDVGTATVGTITGAAGLAQTTQVGTTTITATSAGVSGHTILRVTSAAVVSVAISPSSFSFAKGTTRDLIATATYSDGTTQSVTKAATWASSDPTTVTVNDSGKATARQAGGVTISATLAGVSGSASSSVTNASLVALAVSPSPAAAPLRVSLPFTAMGTFDDGTTQDLTTIVHWSSSDSAIATVANGSNGSGVATSIGVGSASVSAMFEGVSGASLLTVSLTDLVSIDVSPAAPTIALGESAQFTATGRYADGSTFELSKDVLWTTGAATIAVMSDDSSSEGLAVSSGSGTTLVVAQKDGVSGSASLTVGAPEIVSINISPSNATVVAGGIQAFAAVAVYLDGSAADVTASAIWTTEESSAATIIGPGVVRGIASGVATIRASVGGKQGTATLTVVPPALVSMIISPSTVSLTSGASHQLAAIGTYTDGSIKDLTTSVSWTTSNTGIATVLAGLVYGVSTGTVSINATFGSLSASATVSVGPMVTLVSLQIVPNNVTIAPNAFGATQQFNAIGTYSDQSARLVTSVVTWASASGNVAFVSNQVGSNGLATTAGYGTTVVSAALGGIAAMTSLSVSPRLAVVTVVPSTASISQGSSVQLQAIANYADGTSHDITGQVTWATADPSIATVGGGLANGSSPGTATIVATLSGVSGTSRVTVGPPPTQTVLGLGVGAPAPVGGGVLIRSSLSPTLNVDANAVVIAPTITTTSSGRHQILSSLYVAPPTVIDSGASVTDAATVYIGGPPLVTGASNRSLYVFSGNSVIKDRLGVGAVTSPDSILHVQTADSTYAAHFTNTTPQNPYIVWIQEPPAASHGYPLLNVTDASSAHSYFRVDSGGYVYFGDSFFGLGGGAKPTLGTIGGIGPTNREQKGWMRVFDSSGTAFWLPVWR